MSMQRTDSESYSEKALLTLAVIMLIGVLGILAYAAHSWSATHPFLTIIGIGMLVAGAAVLGGGLLGFLFGIPRADLREEEGEGKGVVYRANTNLEQISDWLTKILVGVGLTQLTSIPDRLQQIANYIASGLGGSDSSRIFAMAVMVYFVVCGFLFGYLWTRLFLAGALRQADLIAIGALAKQVSAIQKQPEIDANALSLTERQLNPSTDTPEVSYEELVAAIRAASPTVKVQIFNRAQAVRSENWRDLKTKPVMERTIPIFRTLIESDPQGQFHRNHGQLGFALKDQRTPAYAEAEAELTKAIEIRGSWEENGWLFYEFNRAICRIMLDEAYRRGKASDADTRAKIIDDLHAASQSDLRSLIAEVPEIQSWMKVNKVSQRDLA